MPCSVCRQTTASCEAGDVCDILTLPEFFWSRSTHAIAAKADVSTGIERVYLRLCEIKLRSFTMKLFHSQCPGHVLHLRQRKAELFQILYSLRTRRSDIPKPYHDIFTDFLKHMLSYQCNRIKPVSPELHIMHPRVVDKIVDRKIDAEPMPWLDLASVALESSWPAADTGIRIEPYVGHKIQNCVAQKRLKKHEERLKKLERGWRP